MQYIQTQNAPTAVGPYSQGVRTGALVFVSGQLGILPSTGRLVEGGLVAQARQALANVAAVLQAAGGGLDTVVSVDVFLTDMEQFAQFNGAYAEVMGQRRPARAVVGVASLPLGALVEIRAVALVQRMAGEEQ
jgi:2-iminobutanoate/2-iminopropanoate deaminase